MYMYMYEVALPFTGIRFGWAGNGWLSLRFGIGSSYWIMNFKYSIHTTTHSCITTPSHSHCSAQLLQAVYDNLLLNPQILDITVEDPSDEFVALRDFVDCRNAMKMESFQPPKIHQPFSKELEELCRQKLKLHKVGRERGGEERGRERERVVSCLRYWSARIHIYEQWSFPETLMFAMFTSMYQWLQDYKLLFLHLASVTEGVWDSETESDWSQQPRTVQGIQTHSQEQTKWTLPGSCAYY